MWRDLDTPSSKSLRHVRCLVDEMSFWGLAYFQGRTLLVSGSVWIMLAAYFTLGKLFLPPISRLKKPITQGYKGGSFSGNISSPKKSPSSAHPSVANTNFPEVSQQLSPLGRSLTATWKERRLITPRHCGQRVKIQKKNNISWKCRRKKAKTTTKVWSLFFPWKTHPSTKKKHAIRLLSKFADKVLK